MIRMLAALVVMVVVTGCPPSDATLGVNLATKRADFELLVGVLDDAGIELITDTEFKPHTPAADQERIRALMKELGVHLAARAGGRTKLETYAAGLAVSGIYRGYFFQRDGGLGDDLKVGERVRLDKGSAVKVDDHWFVYQN